MNETGARTPSSAACPKRRGRRLVAVLAAALVLFFAAGALAARPARAADEENRVTDPGSIPANVSAEALSGVVRVKWSPPPAPPEEVLGYYIYRWKGDPTGDPAFLGFAEAYETEYPDFEALNGQSYTYAVAAKYDWGRESDYSAYAVAAPTVRGLEIILVLNQATAQVNGEPVPLDAPAQSINDRAMVPLRFVGSYLGATIKWEGETKKITAILGARAVVLWVGKTAASVDGKEQPLSAPPVMVNGRTMVPIRFIAEAFGAAVSFDSNTRRVTVTMGDNDATQDSATELAVGTTIQSALNGSNDVDVYRIPVTGSQDYRVWTHDLGADCDTYLSVMYQSGADLAVWYSNDDAIWNSKASEITFPYSTGSGPFLYVRVQSARPGGANLAGNYSISVERVTEPNDKPWQGPVLTIGAAPTQGTLHYATDTDWYSFTATGGKTYTVKTANLVWMDPTGKVVQGDTYLNLWSLTLNRELKTIASDRNSGDEPGASKIVFVAPDTATYYLAVESPSGSGRFGLYTVQVGESQPEANDTWGQAEAVRVDRDAPLEWLASGDDQDWFKFDASAGTGYFIQTVGSVNTVLTLYGTGGQQELAADDDAPGGGSVIRWTAPETGTYYAKVENYFTGGTYLGLGSYRFLVTTTGPEYNNDPGFATKLQTGQSVKGSLVAADFDYYTFEVRKGLTYTVETSDLGEGCDTYVVLVDKDGNVLADNDDAGGFDGSRASRAQWVATFDGTVYVTVTIPADSLPEGVDGTGTYTITVTSAAAGTSF